MRKYCRAYRLTEMQQYEMWNTKSRNVQDLSDESICYLWDDLVVVKSPVQDEGVLYDEVTEDWRKFCKEHLHFEIPADLT